MPARKNFGMAYANSPFSNQTKRRRRAAEVPPTMSLHDAETVNRVLGCLNTAQPPTGQGLEHEPNEWVDVDHLNKDADAAPNPPPAETIADRFARLSRGARFAERRQKLLQQWFVFYSYN